MAESRRGSRRLAIELTVASLVFCGLALVLGARHVSRAETGTKTADDEVPPQITVFGVIATPGSKTIDSNLTRISTQLGKLLPKHGFRLLDVQRRCIVAGESVTCKLSNGYTATISLVQTVDENGKVQLRYELFQGKDRQFSTLVKTPLNQLFFCQQALPGGSQLLIGVGAR